MAQEGAFDEGSDAGAFVGVELVERGQVQAQRLVLGAAFVGVEDEVVGGDGQRHGECAEHIERGLVGAGLVAAQWVTWTPTVSARVCWVMPRCLRTAATRWAKSMAARRSSRLVTRWVK